MISCDMKILLFNTKRKKIHSKDKQLGQENKRKNTYKLISFFLYTFLFDGIG